MILITAAKDTDFIYPIHDAMFFRSITGLESCVFDYLENFKAEIITNNEVRIRPGVGMIQGRIFEVVPDTYDSVTIENGTQGENRIDLIAARFEADEETNTQEATWHVIKGTPVAGDPTAPTCTEGDIDAGDTVAEIPIAEVELEGINIVDVRMVYPALASNLEASKISDATVEKYIPLGFNPAEYSGGGNR